VVINKPSGVVVNRAASVEEETVQDWVEYKGIIKSGDYEINESIMSVSKLETSEDWEEVNRQAFYTRSGIVHRLDKETSGVLVVAKTPEAFVDLLRQFREREVKKEYLALVHGRVKQDEGLIEAPVGRLPWNRERFGVLAGGRPAVTRYRVEQVFSNADISGYAEKPNFTLVRLFPETGRTHQIRIHLKHLGHPVVGDAFYAGRKTARRDRRWCGRLWLHAERLELADVANAQRVFVVDVPGELDAILAKFG
jgi:RluA family pseudouridine synthase